MKQVARHSILVAFAAGFALLSTGVHSEELYNLEIMFKKSYAEWAPDSVSGFGQDICGAGDVNGDGYDDIGAAAWDLDSPGGWLNMIYVFLGGSPMDTIPDVILRDTYRGGATDVSLAGGDVNDDGLCDIVVGLPYGPGNVDIYFGGNPMDTVVDLVLTEPFPESFFGCDVSTGDVNGDGFCDIIASDYDKNDGEGAVYVFYGGPLLDNIPDIILRGHSREGFGMTVGSGGDVNDDGYDDIVAGAWANSDRFSMGGKIYIYYGGDPMDTAYDVAMYGEGTEQCLGWEPVSIARGAVRYDYVIAGTEFWPCGFPADCEGKVYVLYGGDPMDSIADVCMHGQTDLASLGKAASAGDVDGDGSQDVVAGALHVESDYAGAMYVWLAHTMKMDTLPDAWMKGDTADLVVGFVVQSAGDVDGDGRDEVMTSNYPAPIRQHTVWVCKYIGTGVREQRISGPAPCSHGHITCAPNPFRSSAEVRISLDEGFRAADSLISLQVCDITGRRIRTFDVGTGGKLVRWYGEDDEGVILPNGTYFIRASSERYIKSTKVVLIR
jgi:hypothetical protein